MSEEGLIRANGSMFPGCSTEVQFQCTKSSVPQLNNDQMTTADNAVTQCDDMPLLVRKKPFFF